MKYLLSTGESTTKYDLYLIDMFRLYLSIYPGDIPGSDIGFDFILSDIKKDELLDEINSRLETVLKQFNNNSLLNVNPLSIDQVYMISDDTVEIVVYSSSGATDTITINIDNNENT